MAICYAHKYASFEEWLESRPVCVQELAREFPFGSTITDVTGQTAFVLGYTEHDALILSMVDPNVDYDGSYESRFHSPASHFRKH